MTIDVRDLLSTAVKVPGISPQEQAPPEDLYPFPKLSKEHQEQLERFLRAKVSSRLLHPSCSHLEHVVASARWEIVELILLMMKGA